MQQVSSAVLSTVPPTRQEHPCVVDPKIKKVQLVVRDRNFAITPSSDASDAVFSNRVQKRKRVEGSSVDKTYSNHQPYISLQGNNLLVILTYPQMTDDYLKALVQDIQERIKDQAIAVDLRFTHLKNTPNLLEITDHGLAILTVLPIKSLSLDSCILSAKSVTATGIAQFISPLQLENLVLKGNNLDGDAIDVEHVLPALLYQRDLQSLILKRIRNEEFMRRLIINLDYWLRTLTTLGLVNCMSVDNDTLVELAKKRPKLDKLVLNGCKGINNLEPLQSMTLQSLAICGIENAPFYIEDILAKESIEEIAVESFDEQDLEIVASCKKLRVLHLSLSSVTLPILMKLSELQLLQVLRLSKCSFSEEAWEKLFDLPFSQLFVSGSRVRAEKRAPSLSYNLQF